MIGLNTAKKSIGILTLFASVAVGGVAYAAPEMTTPASEGTKGLHEKEAGKIPSQPDALPQTPPKEAIYSTFSFPKNDVKATEEQVAEACARLEKGLGTHPGISLLLKGHESFAYNPASMANMVKQSCTNITAEKIAAAPAPETLLKDVPANVQKGRLAALLADSANAACTNLAGKIETLPGFTAIFSKDEKGFMDACVTNAQPQQQQPQADVPDTDDQALEGEEPPVDEAQLSQACNKLLNMAVKHAGLNLLVMGHDRVPYDPAPLASAFKKQCGVEEDSWAQIPKHSAVSSKIRDASPEFLERARHNACGLLGTLSQSDPAVAYVLGSDPAMRNALQNACAARPKAP